jgi:hypothetical protein
VPRAGGSSGCAAFAGACLVTCAITVELFDGLGRATRGRQLWLRNVLASAVALAAGWLAFVLIVSYLPRAALLPVAGFTPAEQLTAIAVAAGGYTLVGMIVGTILLYALVNPLALALRIERYIVDEVDDLDLEPRRTDGSPAFAAPRSAAARPKPKAQIVETGPVARAGRSGASNSRPFTSDEVAFFNAGEELAAKPAADSFSDLERRDDH